MVERPIKKSDRQNVAASDVVEEIKKPDRQNVATSDVVQEVLETESSPIEGSPSSITQSSEPRKIILPVVGKDKTRGKDQTRGSRGDQKEDLRSTPGNPALARGPKPTKLKPPVIKETQSETTEESVTEAEQETTAEG